VSRAVQACIGLGANLGDGIAAVQGALQALDALPDTRVLKASRLYRTPAWGNTDQPAFVNAAALIDTSLDARDLLDHMLSIERDFGRDRTGVERWSARTLDLDLLVEVAPDAVIPGRGRASDLVAAMVTGDIHPLG